jgi:hypothetical protein
MDWIGALIFITGGILFHRILERRKSDSKLRSGWGPDDRLYAGDMCQLNSPTPPSVKVLATEPLIPLDVFRSYDVCAKCS